MRTKEAFFGERAQGSQLRVLFSEENGLDAK